MVSSKKPRASAEAVTRTRACSCTNDYQAIFDGVNAAITIHRVEDGFVRDVNRTACELLGCSRDELIDAPLSRIWPAAADPAVIASVRQSFLESPEKKVSLTCCCRRKDGTDFWADVQLQVWEINGSPHILNVMRDITERRERELLLRENDQRLRDIVENSRDIIYRRNIATGRVEYASGAVFDILGYTPQEMMAMSREEHILMVHPDNRALLGGHRDLVLSGQADSHDLCCVRFRMMHKSGEWRWLEGNFGYTRDDAGNYRYVVGVLRDANAQVAAEDALRVSEERYRRLVENGVVGLVVAQNGYLKYANPKITEYTGYGNDELLTRPWVEFFHPDDRALALEMYQRRYSGEDSDETYRGRIQCKDGRIIWVEIGGVIVQWEGRPATIAFLTDVDRQVRAEQNLRTERDLVSRLMETMPVGALMINRQLEIAFVNERAVQIFNTTREEMQRRGRYEDWAVLDADGRPMSPDELPFRKVFTTLEPTYGFRHCMDVQAGKRAYLSVNVVPLTDAAGAFDGMVVTVEDITERWLAEEQVRVFKTIADHSPYGILLVDMDDHVLYANKAAAAMHGSEIEEMIGTFFPSLIAFNGQGGVEAARKQLLDTGVHTEADLEHIHRDGHRFTTMTAGVLVHDNAGNPKFTAMTMIDMTETKHLQECAARAERLETAGRIAGQVAHDFNNLLGPLVAYPELLRDEIGESHSASPYVDAMETAARQMAEINQQLLTLGRRGHYVVQPINLNAIVEQITEQVKPRTASVGVHLQLEADLMNVKAGTAQIARAVFNLVNNALDAMEEIGDLTIRTENWYADRTVGNYNQIPTGEYVKLTVTDSGCGIDPENLNHIFEPFFTTKSADANRGSGLGLSVVHAVVNDHHGYIDIDSRVGQGTSVYVYLPVTREATSVESEDIPHGRGESILVVDDDPLQREVSFRLLSKLGYNVHTAESGEKALARLKLERFDLIVLDMIMPGGLDGAETLEHIHAIEPTQKAIIASGYVENEKLKRAHALGATVFLRKPLTLAILARAVHDEIRRVPTETT